MTYQKSTVPLKTGDIIGVAYNNYIHLRIFKGYGKEGNPQFWNPREIIQYERYHSQNLKGKPFKPWMGYVNTHADGRIVKLTEDALTPEDRDDVIEAKTILANAGIIKLETKEHDYYEIG